MREWRCTKCRRMLAEYDVIEGSVALSRICPRCHTPNAAVFKADTATSLTDRQTSSIVVSEENN